MSAPADTLFGGGLVLYQPARGRGYRVNVDAVLLAAFAGEERRAKHVVDLGAGVGGVALSMLYRDRAGDVLLVERDPDLASLAAKNVEANDWQARGHVLHVDVARKGLLPHATADLVVCNPPYTTPGRGRTPVVAADARVGPLGVFAAAARHVLGPRGRAAFVYPAEQLLLLFETLRAAGLEPKRLRFVHATDTDPARVALVLAIPAKKGGLVVLPPFVERQNGRPSTDLDALLAR